MNIWRVLIVLKTNRTSICSKVLSFKKKVASKNFVHCWFVASKNAFIFKQKLFRICCLFNNFLSCQKLKWVNATLWNFVKSESSIVAFNLRWLNQLNASLIGEYFTSNINNNTPKGFCGGKTHKNQLFAFVVSWYFSRTVEDVDLGTKYSS